MKMRLTEAVAEGTQASRNLGSIGTVKLRHALEQARMQVDFHKVPVKGLVCREARALRTSLLTA